MNIPPKVDSMRACLPSLPKVEVSRLCRTPSILYWPESSELRWAGAGILTPDRTQIMHSPEHFLRLRPLRSVPYCGPYPRSHHALETHRCPRLGGDLAVTGILFPVQFERRPRKTADPTLRTRVRNRSLVAVRGLLAGANTLCGFYAFSTLPLADVYAIVFFTPIVVTLASIPILGETVGMHRIAAIVVRPSASAG